MFPDPAVLAAVKLVVKLLPPTVVLHPMVTEPLIALIVPTAESAVTLMVEPAAIGPPFRSFRLNWIEPLAFAAIASGRVVGLRSVMFTPLVAMMMRCEAPMASVLVLQVVGGEPVQVIPLKVPSGASHVPFWLKSRKYSPRSYLVFSLSSR